ncbi:hypothetical protein [Streptomyces sp. NPDC059881]|uniref:hypothetical protein n=1 Tax=Streptomyces sp. NPDC059881 TaxID=3346986 RepID=UPI003662C9A8
MEFVGPGEETYGLRHGQAQLRRRDDVDVDVDAEPQQLATRAVDTSPTCGPIP